MPGAAAIGIRGIGTAPAFVALFLYSLLPVVANTVVGLAGVPRAANDAARGMGMTDRQRLFQVEFPLAFPVILTGIRIVLVQNIGLATIAALIGGGGFGVFVFQGIGQTAMDLVLLGAVPTVALAFAAAVMLDASHRTHPESQGSGRMIEIENLTKRYGETAVVDDVSMVIEPRTVAAIVGTSGSGKTTLLRMINRLVEPSAGVIKLDGVDNRSLPELRAAPQHRLCHPGAWPVSAPHGRARTSPPCRRLLGWDKARISARVDELLTLFQLDPADFGPRYPHELSGGQQQRVGVARALAAEPNVLLMDEPFGALDPIIRAKAQDDLLAIQKRFGTTIILVTHDMEEAIHLGHKIAVMDAGKLVQYAPPAEILARPATEFVETLIGTGERPFKLLSLGAVGDAVEAGEADGEAIPATATQRDALAELLWSGRPALPVRGDDGASLGKVTIEGLVKRAARPA